MKNKFFVLLFILCSFLLIGCDEEKDDKEENIEPEHTHLFSVDYEYDDEYHWNPSICGHDDSVKKVKHEIIEDFDEHGKFYSCLVCGYNRHESAVSLTINYIYYNGEIIDTIKENHYIGDQYSYKSPEIDYMLPDQLIVEGIVEGEMVVDVIYDYSFEAVDLTAIKPVPLDNKDSISISFITSGVLKENDVLLRGDTFELCPNKLLLRNGVEANIYSATWDNSSAVAAPNGNRYSVFSQLDDEKIVTINITPSKNIEFYVNGKLQYVYYANVMSDDFTANYNNYDYKLISDLVEEFLTEISTKGFSVVKKTIHNLMVGNSLTSSEVEKLHNDFINVKVKYLNENGDNIAVVTNVFGKKNETYSIDVKEIVGFTTTVKKVEGVFDKNQECEVVYQAIGVERLPQGVNGINKPNEFDWANMNSWYYIARKLRGDYTITVTYDLKANQFDENAYYSSWKTVLSIAFEESTLDRWICRFDSYDWQDDIDGDGRNLGAYSSAGSMFKENSLKEYQELSKDCTVVATFIRRGSTISMTCIITPNVENEYLDEVYYWKCTLQNVFVNEIGLAFSCECASIKVSSIIY